MSSIEERVVKMTFDNAQFERNAGTTLSTLDKLKKALSFSGASQALSNLQSQTSRFSMTTMESAAQAVMDRFSLMGVVTNEVLTRIADTAINTGTSIVKALTVEPVLSGLQEYETQINSVQTILANTREKLAKNEGLDTEAKQVERINGVLDELNTYADKTIYNFTQMTQNLGRFTAAGVELDDAEKAIMGIANLAAVSGANSTEASRAMYQLSQALAAGVVNLQDWRSVENASMGGAIFQNAIMETARVRGIAVDEMLEEAGSFRQMLSQENFESWLTSDILLESLEKFTAGSEGYTKAQVEQQRELWKARGYSQEQIEDLISNMDILDEKQEQEIRNYWLAKGYNDEQVNGILDLGKTANDASTKVKTLSQLIDTVKESLQSGWTQSFEYVIGDFEQAKILWTEINDILSLYIQKSANARNEMLKGWSTGRTDEDGKLIDTNGTGREKVIAGIRNAFQGTLAVILEINEAWDRSFLHKGMADDLSLTTEKLIDLSQKFMVFTQEFKNLFVGANGESTPFLKELGAIADSVFGSLRNLYDGLSDIGSILGSGITIGVTEFAKAFEIFYSDGILYDYLNTISINFKNFAETLKDKVFTDENLTNFFSGLANAVKTLFEIKMEVGLAAWGEFDTLMRNISNDYADVGTFFSNLGGDLDNLSTALHNLLHNENGENNLTNTFATVRENLEGFIKDIQENTDFKDIHDIFNDLTNFINTHPEMIFGTIENVLNGIANIGETLYGIFKPFFDALIETFTIEDIAGAVNDISDAFRRFTEYFKLDSGDMNNLQTFFKGLFDVIKVVSEIIYNSAIGAFDALGNVLSSIIVPDGGIITFLGELGETLSVFAAKVSEAFSENGTSKFSLLADVIRHLGDVIADFFRTITGGGEGPNFFTMIREWISGIDLSGVADALHSFATGFTEVRETVDAGKETPGIFERLGKALGVIANTLVELVKHIDIPALLASISSLLMTNSIKDFLDNMNKVAGDNIITKIGKSVSSAIGEIKKAFEDLQSTLKVVQLLAIAAAIGIIAHALVEISSIPTDKIASSLGALAAGIGEMLAAILIFNKMDKTGSGLTGGLQETLSTVALLVGVADSIKKIAEALSMIAEIDPDALIPSVIALGAVMGELVGMMAGLKQTGVTDATGTFIAISIALKILASAMKDLADLNMDQLAVGITGIAGGMATLVIGLNNLTSDTEGFMKAGLSMILIGAALKIVASAIIDLSELNLQDLAEGIAGVASSMAILVIGMNNISEDTSGFMKTALAMIMVGTALKIVASAIIDLSELSLQDLAEGIAGVASSMAILVIGMNNLTEDTSGFMSAAVSMILMGAALKIVASAITDLGSLNLQDLAEGVAGVTASMLVLVKGMQEFGNENQNVMLAATSMIMMGVALKIVASAIVDIGSLSLQDVAEGIAGVASSMLILVAGMNSITSDTDGLIKAATSMILIGAALKIVASAILDLADLDLVDLAEGIAGVAASMLILVAGLNSITTDTAGLISGAAAMILMGAALKVIASAVIDLASLDLMSLIQGLAGVAGILVEMGIASNAIKIDMATAAGMVAMGIAIGIMAPAIALLAGIDILGLVTALGALAIGMIAFGKVAEVLTPAIGSILAFAGAIALTGAGLLAIAAAFTMVAGMIVGMGPMAGTAIAHLCQVIIDTVPQILAAVTAVASGVLQTIITVTPQIVQAAVVVVTSVLTGLVEVLPSITETVITIIQSVCQVIVESLPDVMTTLGEVVTQVCAFITENAPTIIDTALTFFETFLTKVADHIPKMVQAGCDIVKGFLKGVADNIEDMVKSGIDVLVNFMKGVTEKLPEVIDQAFKVIISFIDGLASAIEENHDELWDAIGHLIKAIVDAIIDGFTKVTKAAGELIDEFVSTFSLPDFVNKVFEVGSNLVSGIIDGIGSGLASIGQAAMDVGNSALEALGISLEEHSPSEATARMGEFFGEGFSNGLLGSIPGIEDGASSMAQSAISSFQNTINESMPDLESTNFNFGQDALGAFGDGITYSMPGLEDTSAGVAQAAMEAFGNGIDTDSLSMDMSLDPSITPVLDYSGVEDAIGNMSDYSQMISTTATSNVTADVSEGANSVNEKITSFMKMYEDGVQVINNGLTAADARLDMINKSSVDIGNLINQGIEVISKLQMVLDTGTLVGELTPQINRALGNEYALSERGVR